MSRRPSGIVRSLSVALVAAGLAGATPSHAAVVTTNQRCVVPLVGAFSVPFSSDFAIPASLPAGATQQFPVTTTLTLPVELQEILRRLGVVTVEPKSLRPAVEITPSTESWKRGTSGSGPVVAVPEQPESPLTLSVNGSVSVTAPAYDGAATFRLLSPSDLGLMLRDAAGEEIRLYDDSLPDTDQDRYWTEVTCTFGPSPAPIGSTTVVAPMPEPLDFFGSTRTARSITMTWYRPDSHVANTRYVVTQRILSGPFYGDTVSQTTTGTSATFGGLTPDRFYGFTIRAETTSGASAESAEYVMSTAPLSAPPSPPTALRATAVTDRSLQLSWDAATDDDGVTGYDVFQDDVKIDHVGSLTKAVTGLRAATSYRFKVVAIDDSGNATASDELSVKTTSGTPLLRSFQSSGRAALPTLVTDSFTVNGTVDQAIFTATGQMTGSMTLMERTLTLRSSGSIPVRGRVVVVPVGEFEGTSIAARQTFKQKLRVKIPAATVFGVPVANLGNCQTRSTSIATFTSTGTVTASGGTVVGTFPVSGFSGCAALSGIVDLGGSTTGNSIALTLSVS